MSISAEAVRRGCEKSAVGIDLAVCILFYERLDQTIECIRSFLPSGVNIYILNNGSSSSSRQALGGFCDRYKQIKIFDSDVNLGVGPGRNYLVTHTTEEWLLFVDNDIVVKTLDWLQRFTEYVSLYNDVEVFVPRLYNIHEYSYAPYRSIRIVGAKAFHDVEITNDMTNTFLGGASFVSRKLFDRLGLYDEKMFVGFEDLEYCIRAILLGAPVKARLIHDIELVHNHRQVIRERDKYSVLTYNIDLVEASFNRMNEKHNIIFEGKHWRNWTVRQRAKVLKKPIIAFKNAWILKKRIIDLKNTWIQLIPRSARKMVREILMKNRRAPTNCSLFMTERRNFKGSTFYRSITDVKESKEMTLATVQRVLSLYPSINSFLVAGLGEPTLCSDFVDIVDFLKRNGKFVEIVTHGTNSDKLSALAYEPNYLSISLKGYDNKSYLDYTGVAAYDKVIETFLKLKARIKNVGFSYVLDRTNYRDLDKVLPLCDSLRPDFLYLTNYLVYDPVTTDEVQKIITVKDTDIINYINEMCAERDYIKLKPVYVDFENPKFNCNSYNYMINLDGWGNIGGCQWQIPPDASFGNIFKDKDPYNSLKMRKCRYLVLIKSYAHRECRFCFETWRPRAES